MWEYWPYILGIIIALAIVIFFVILILSIVDFERITPVSRGIAHAFEAGIFFSQVIGGAAVSFGRVIVGVMVLLFSLLRIDKPIFPKWILNLMYFDMSSRSYISFVKLYCICNNPIKVTFIEEILRSNEKPKRGINKFRLLWIHNNPLLIQKVNEKLQKEKDKMLAKEKEEVKV